LLRKRENNAKTRFGDVIKHITHSLLWHPAQDKPNRRFTSTGSFAVIWGFR